MGDFFSHEWIPILLNMSLTASAVILCVLLVRLALRRAPRVFSNALWAVVLFQVVYKHYHCKKFVYQPLKRIPRRKPQAEQFDAKDFSL